MNKQAVIYRYIKQHPGTSLKEIANAMPWDYYYNRMKHFGEITGRMVKNGSIKRIRKGSFCINTIPHHRRNGKNINSNQLELF